MRNFFSHRGCRGLCGGTRRNVPGYGGLLPMVRILLAERVPAHGCVLMVGAGGG
jgi:tRNA (cmo5U34)-methyltransferase